MNMPTHMPRLKGFRYPREIISYAVWAYHRLALSAADVEDLLAARGVLVRREAIRLWVNRFGRYFADCIPPGPITLRNLRRDHVSSKFHKLTPTTWQYPPG